MANPRVVCFLEDLMHEQMISALIRRVAADLGIEPRAVQIETLNARGGVPAAIAGFKEFGRALLAGEIPRPDVLVIALDADCDPGGRRRSLAELVASLSGHACVVVCVPDPYIERWYLLDLGALRDVLGSGPSGALPHTCDKGFYKAELVATIENAGFTPLLGGYEYADQLAPAIDLYHAGEADPEFRRFVDDVEQCLKPFVA